jgi:hypothetical protein
MNFTKVSGPVLEMLGIRVDKLAGERAMHQTGLERGGAEARCRPPLPRAAVPGFRLQPRQCRWLATAVPGQRRADVHPVLPLHRLPRHRRGNHQPLGNRARQRDDPAMPTPTVQARTICSPPCPRRNSNAWRASWNGSRCRSVKCSTNPAASCSTPISRPPPSSRCTTSWSPAPRPNRRAWATRASSAFRCSWAATPRPARPWCRPRATPTGWRASLLKQEFNRGGLLQRLLLRYTQALMTQMAQTAVCNRHHSVEQQLCRWLLLTLDRLPTNELVMTQELIANMLGVRREGITEAAGKLQRAGCDQLPPRPHFGTASRRIGSAYANATPW